MKILSRIFISCVVFFVLLFEFSQCQRISILEMQEELILDMIERQIMEDSYDQGIQRLPRLWDKQLGESERLSKLP